MVKVTNRYICLERIHIIPNVVAISLLLFITVFLGACQAEQPVANTQTVDQSTPIPFTVTATIDLPSPTITQTATETAGLSSPTPTQVAPSPEPETKSIPALSQLTVTSNLPDATVYIDEREVGKTPYEEMWPVGTYQLTVALPGFQPHQQEIVLNEGRPLSLTIEFAFTASIERLLNVCMDHFWWSEEGDAVYYVECNYGYAFQGRAYESGRRIEEGPIWRLELDSGEVTQVEDVWPPGWVPREYQSLVPDTIPPQLIGVSPSGKRVIFLEEIVPDIPTPTPEPSPDPMQIGPEPFMPEYIAHAVLESGVVVELGMIDSLPDFFLWSADEQLVFISSNFFAGPEHEGWLINLQEESIQALVPPEEPGLDRAYFLNASILPNGEAILYRPYTTEPYYIWNFTTGDRVQLEAGLGYYEWLEESRYLIFSNSDGLSWYDAATGVVETILDETVWPPGRWQLSPDGDKMILTKSVGAGLWLVILDSN